MRADVCGEHAPGAIPMANPGARVAHARGELLALVGAREGQEHHSHTGISGHHYGSFLQ